MGENYTAGGVNGVHDMGGMHGFGPVVQEKDEPVFHDRWEGRVRGIFQRTVGRQYNLDEFRKVIELMEPSDYLRARYYEKWLHAVERLLTEEGLATGASRGRYEGGVKPRFAAGDRVRARNVHPAGHTRLPRYVRGKEGVVVSVAGPYRLPDANAHGDHDTWGFVYPVRFKAADLWGEGSHSVTVDLWEQYLEANQ